MGPELAKRRMQTESQFSNYFKPIIFNYFLSPVAFFSHSWLTLNWEVRTLNFGVGKTNKATLKDFSKGEPLIWFVCSGRELDKT